MSPAVEAELLEGLVLGSGGRVYLCSTELNLLQHELNLSIGGRGVGAWERRPCVPLQPLQH
jgi:hypothetical protein